MAAIKSFGERIADALVEDGLLTTQQVGELLVQQKNWERVSSNSSWKKPVSANRT